LFGDREGETYASHPPCLPTQAFGFGTGLRIFLLKICHRHILAENFAVGHARVSENSFFSLLSVLKYKFKYSRALPPR
jgi:hypothetical protein